MRASLGTLLFLAALVSPLGLPGTILPGACGDDKVTFDVRTQKDQPAPAAPLWQQRHRKNNLLNL